MAKSGRGRFLNFGGILIVFSLLFDWEIRVRQQPRRLSPRQVELFRSYLNEAPPHFISIEAPSNDREAEALANEFVALFNSAGWTTPGVPPGGTHFSPPVEDIVISVKNVDSVQPHVSILQRAFEAIGMPAKVEVSGSEPAPEIQLIVGHKPSR